MKNIEALYGKSPHIHVHTLINTVLSALKYTMYTCICPLYVYQKIRGSLTQNELLKLFLYNSVQQTTTSFLVSWAAPVNTERASYYIIQVFCISTNEQCNCCTINTNKRSEKRNSIEEPNKLLLWYMYVWRKKE